MGHRSLSPWPFWSSLVGVTFRIFISLFLFCCRRRFVSFLFWGCPPDFQCKFKRAQTAFTTIPVAAGAECLLLIYLERNTLALHSHDLENCVLSMNCSFLRLALAVHIRFVRPPEQVNQKRGESRAGLPGFTPAAPTAQEKIGLCFCEGRKRP